MRWEETQIKGIQKSKHKSRNVSSKGMNEGDQCEKRSHKKGGAYTGEQELGVKTTFQLEGDHEMGNCRGKKWGGGTVWGVVVELKKKRKGYAVWKKC